MNATFTARSSRLVTCSLASVPANSMAWVPISEPLRKTLKSGVARRGQARAGSTPRPPSRPRASCDRVLTRGCMRLRSSALLLGHRLTLTSSASARNRAAPARFRAFPRSARPAHAGGPVPALRDHRRTATASPANNASTEPSDRLRTQPSSPRAVGLALGPGPKPYPLHLTINSHLVPRVFDGVRHADNPTSSGPRLDPHRCDRRPSRATLRRSIRRVPS